MLSAGCATKIAKINPALTERIPAPVLQGTTYNDAIVLGVESRAIEAAITAARLTGRLAQDQASIPDTDLGQE